MLCMRGGGPSVAGGGLASLDEWPAERPLIFFSAISLRTDPTTAAPEPRAARVWGTGTGDYKILNY